MLLCRSRTESPCNRPCKVGGLSRSSNAPVMRSDPKASIHSLNGRLLVTSVPSDRRRGARSRDRKCLAAKRSRQQSWRLCLLCLSPDRIPDGRRPGGVRPPINHWNKSASVSRERASHYPGTIRKISITRPSNRSRRHGCCRCYFAA
jgi:hypothetical protein